MGVTTSAGSDAERFAALFDAYSPRVFFYASRYVERSAVDDIVSETFLVAWRRLDEVPADPLPWLLVVAHNVLANHRRSLARHERRQVESTVLERLVSSDAAVDEVVIARATMLNALKALTSSEREALLLIAWDGLSPAEAADLTGCSTRTFAVRLHRARRHLARAIEVAGRPPGSSVTALLKETT